MVGVDRNPRPESDWSKFRPFHRIYFELNQKNGAALFAVRRAFHISLDVTSQKSGSFHVVDLSASLDLVILTHFLLFFRPCLSMLIGLFLLLSAQGLAARPVRNDETTNHLAGLLRMAGSLPAPAHRPHPSLRIS